VAEGGQGDVGHSAVLGVVSNRLRQGKHLFRDVEELFSNLLIIALIRLKVNILLMIPPL